MWILSQLCLLFWWKGLLDELWSYSLPETLSEASGPTVWNMTAAKSSLFYLMTDTKLVTTWYKDIFMSKLAGKWTLFQASQCKCPVLPKHAQQEQPPDPVMGLRNFSSHAPSIKRFQMQGLTFPAYTAALSCTQTQLQQCHSHCMQKKWPGLSVWGAGPPLSKFFSVWPTTWALNTPNHVYLLSPFEFEGGGWRIVWFSSISTTHLVLSSISAKQWRKVVWVSFPFKKKKSPDKTKKHFWNVRKNMQK